MAIPPGEIIPIDGAHDYADYLLAEVVELRRQRDRYAAALRLAVTAADHRNCPLPPFVHAVNTESDQ